MKKRTKASVARQKPAVAQQAAPAPASAPAPSPDFARAVALHQQGKLTEAEALYRAVLTVTPQSVDALHLLGVLKAQTKQSAEAVELIDRAIRLAPNNPAFYSNRGNALKELKRFDEALASFDKAVALDPEFAEGWSNRGNALRELERPAEALASYDRAVALVLLRSTVRSMPVAAE